MPAPADVRERAAELLADLPEHRRELFDLRLERWWADLDSGLRAVYPAAQVTALRMRLLELACSAYRERDAQLSRLDLARTLTPDWLQHPSVVGYAAYAERFGGTLKGVGEHVDYLRELGVTYLHLLPLVQPRPGDSDGGYAVADYRTVRPDLGSVDDLRDLATRLRGEGMSLVVDLVLNHVAREHDWAAKARAGDPRYRAYFYLYDDRTLPDQFERTLPEVFPDFAPGSFSWDEEVQAWVWTTFNTFQWDVNWTNPDVLMEYAELILWLANLGVEVIRFDAIAFLWKRMGTSCQNQPEVHALTQALRALGRVVCPALAFKAEAIVGPADLLHYLGRGIYHGKVSDLAYHNSLMVQIWSMLAAGDVRLGAHALGSLSPAPSTTTWITYVRCHDDIGWAIDPDDARHVGLNGYEHQRFLSDYYVGAVPGSDARGLVFQANPQTGDRRISGTTATLAGVEAATARRDDPATSRATARILLAHAIVYGWGGIPVIWSGDELAMTDDPKWAQEEGHAQDNRWAHRPRLAGSSRAGGTSRGRSPARCSRGSPGWRACGPDCGTCTGRCRPRWPAWTTPGCCTSSGATRWGTWWGSTTLRASGDPGRPTGSGQTTASTSPRTRSAGSSCCPAETATSGCRRTRRGG